ncbi:AraC family transcriptional regulator [Flavihumibacter petaseus]|uniref:Putative AraC family transcriptional regulator n=1 Tax=Flavihumibacter petaseus NBRC 106054 TaxID=1220578 RepID=A0A0E9MW70_9BACT|nr:AraC family transcriptional regulator [Flavihumibacter petaseus]GAO41753.1 putative AraC family transcriptional regulator [Flavihumibacter petaseus NBRC 106054]
MKGNVLYRQYEIEWKELEHFNKPSRRNNFFELIYIIDGTGTQTVNKNHFNYRKGNLFLLTPQDVYSFKISTTTSFFFIRFNELYVKDRIKKDDDAITQVEYILKNASHRPGCILKNKSDKPLIASLVNSVLNEQINQQLYYTRVSEQMVNTIITIVARNIALKLPKNIKETTGEPVIEILNYIQENIFEPQRLRVEKLSEHFNISLNYLGRYFKKQTGDTLQNYIFNFKMRLVETRLLHSDMRISEISEEFSFTDESHLNRLFRKFKGVSPTEFRKINSTKEGKIVEVSL